MLTIYGQQQRLCDGISRREFLRIGGLALGGMSFPQILRAEAQSGVRSPHKAVIMVYLPGGPPHQDLFDLKPDAPTEIRGPFKPIKTKVPGIEICEHLPRMAAMMDKLVPIRSIVGCGPEHAADQCLTGYPSRVSLKQQRPSLGSVIAKIQGPVTKAIPPFVGLAPKMGHMEWANPGQPGYLGPAYAPFIPEGPGLADMVLKGITLDRLSDRMALLTSFDRFRRDLDASGMMDGMDAFNRRAFEVLTSSKLVEALDLSREDAPTRARYGPSSTRNVDDGGPLNNAQFLMARRLVEAGVRCVTLNYGRWDYHGNNFGQCVERLPKLDQAVTALVQDLHDRGLHHDVSVVVWGEFGRTPRINPKGGRDHWPQVSCALLAGGGMRTGQVIGSTNRLAEVAKDRPVDFQEVFATLYHNLGIDLNTTLPDRSGRPMYLIDQREPIRELV